MQKYKVQSTRYKGQAQGSRYKAQEEGPRDKAQDGRDKKQDSSAVRRLYNGNRAASPVLRGIEQLTINNPKYETQNTKFYTRCIISITFSFAY
jgi:hypothetical protein